MIEYNYNHIIDINKYKIKINIADNLFYYNRKIFNNNVLTSLGSFLK